MKVTAETITDEQLRSMINLEWPLDVRHAASCALHANAAPGDRRRDRDRCAAAWNARHGATP